MFSHKINIAIVFVIAISLKSSILPSSAEDLSQEISLNFHNNPSDSTEDLPQEFLDAHNVARHEVGLEPVVWDTEVAAYAQSYAAQRAMDCALVHSHGPFGENIAWSSGDMTAGDAAAMWIDEKHYYDYESNTCNAPEGNTCLHYTQVVWRDSIRIGCAKVQCGNGGTFITCNYDPPGNYIGQKPY